MLTHIFYAVVLLTLEKKTREVVLPLGTRWEIIWKKREREWKKLKI